MVEKVSRWPALALVILIALASGALPVIKMAQSQDGTGWAPVEQAMGKKGTIQGDVLKFSMPRGDLKVAVGDVQIFLALALGSWVAFKKTGNASIAMGDLVLT